MAIYVKPGASLEPYSKIALLDCYVAFAKDWEKEYNRCNYCQNHGSRVW